MLINNLFNDILIKPAKQGCNKLFIVSGYGTAAMAFHHLNTLNKIGIKSNVELIIGMCAKDGLSESNHRGFQQLVEYDFHDDFKCSYVVDLPPVHSKVYAWFKDDKPFFGFAGSANYTQTAFLNNQRESMTECDAELCFDYFKSLCDETIYCTHIDAENLVQIYNDQTYEHLQRHSKTEDIKDVSEDFVLHGLPHIRVSFLDNRGRLPERSGLNWGKRPECNRDPNQAYIRLISDIYNTDFFPDIGTHFTVYTDDAKVLICTRAQQNGKAIHTPHNNSLIGQYFRNRLDLASGALIEKEHLVQYGRTHVDFYKIENETYYMDFSKR